MKCPKYDKEAESGFWLGGENYFCKVAGTFNLSGRTKVKTTRFARAWRCADCRLVFFEYS